jgi:virginiamycin B lyase
MTSRSSVRITEYPVDGTGSGPYGITAGPDDAPWFTQVHHGRIGRVTGAGDVTSLPLDAPTGRPSAITTDGTVTSYDLPTPGSEPHGLAVDADGGAWVALEIGAIAHLTIARPQPGR